MIQTQVIDRVNNYYKFFKWSWSSISQEQYVDNWHIKYLCDELQDLGQYIINREKPPYDLLLINIPPGSSKSSVVCQAFPIWLWLNDPSLCIMTTTYSAPLSIKNTEKAKDIINDLYFEEFNQYIEHKHSKRLKLEVDQKNYFRNNYKGEYSAASVDGTITGFHFNLLIWDDIINPKQAASEAERNHAILYLDQTQPSRKKDSELVPEIGVMQRLHEDDPTGHEIEKAKQGKIIKHICLSAELTDNIKPIELKEFYQDNLLDPKRKNHKVLEKYKINLGSYGYAGQMDQNPAPLEGGMIEKEWFAYFELSDISKNIAWDMWIDGAYTDKTKNDPTGIMIAGYDIINQKLYIRYAESVYKTLPDLIKHITDKEYFKEYDLDSTTDIHIEPKASGHDLYYTLRDEYFFNAKLIRGKIVSLGKTARLTGASPRVESGKVFLLKSNWEVKFIDQICMFPNASHDEYCDLLGYACNYYFKKL